MARSRWLYCTYCKRLFDTRNDYYRQQVIRLQRHRHICENYTFDVTNDVENGKYKQELETYKRLALYYKYKNEESQHRNEKCLNCDKDIDSSEWFSYCCRCVDCYLLEEDRELESNS